MIPVTSRYAPPVGRLVTSIDPRDGKSKRGVVRSPSMPRTGGYFIYVWEVGDRIDKVAARAGFPASAIHAVLDLNPHILDPMNVRVGTKVRVPNA